MNTLTPSQAQDLALAASYALARHVPDMADGFTIGTRYGEIQIHACEVARHPDIIATVQSILQARLQAAGGAA